MPRAGLSSGPPGRSFTTGDAGTYFLWVEGSGPAATGGYTISVAP